MVYCTSYRYPDIDGIACAVALAEQSVAHGTPAQAVYTGTLGPETVFVRDFLDGLPIKPDSGIYLPGDRFVLVDTADPATINPAIDPSMVIRIFDHHPQVYPEKFPNAEITIGQIGSCATLVAEYLRQARHPISRTSAVCLYSAIISNTVNFTNALTTDRDRKQAVYLNKIAKLPPEFVTDMFKAKSNITGSNLVSLLTQESKISTVAGKKIGMVQVEAAAVKDILNKHLPKIVLFLQQFKESNSLDLVMFSGIDILEGRNYFLVGDEPSQSYFSRLLNIRFKDNLAQTSEIIMRKQIFAKAETAI